MKRLLGLSFVLLLCLPAVIVAQEEDGVAAKLDRLERQVRSLRFAIQAAESWEKIKAFLARHVK